MVEKIEPNLALGIKEKDLELITCPICKGIVIDHLQCSICNKSFCKNCRENFWEKNGEGNCYNNCHNPEFKSSKQVNNILEQLKFKCKKGCNEKIPYKELEDHYKNKCEKNKIDYEKEYLDYKNKYEEICKKYDELKKNKTIKQNEEIANKDIKNDLNIEENNQKTFKSQYHNDVLQYKSLYKDNWSCSVCLESFEKKRNSGYNCAKCGFNLCSKCEIVEKSGYIFNDVFNSKTHKHLLREYKGGWGYQICNVCGKSCRGNRKNFRCNLIECDYDLCTECKRKEKISNQESS